MSLRKNPVETIETIELPLIGDARLVPSGTDSNSGLPIASGRAYYVANTSDAVINVLRAGMTTVSFPLSPGVRKIRASAEGYELTATSTENVTVWADPNTDGSPQL